MRVAFAPLFVLALAAACGAKGDLIIGEIKLQSDGTGGVSAAGTGVDPNGGTAHRGVGAVAGATAGTASESGQVGDTPVQAGAAGMDAAGANACPVEEEVPVGSLIHRYSFDGTGAGAVVDSVGGKHGTLEAGAMLDGSGVLTLPGRVNGKNDQFVSFPAGILKGLNELTLVIWTSWITGGAGFQRILDFGDSNIGVGQGDSGRSYLALVPTSNFANGNKFGAELAAPGFPTLSLGSDKDMADAVEV